MQVKNSDFLNFLKRTDDVALKIGCNVEDLCPLLDLSRSSLFSYRTGKRPISSKAWAKLEKLEKEVSKEKTKLPPVSIFHDYNFVTEDKSDYMSAKKSATKNDIKEYIDVVISRAEKDPDGLSYLYKMLKKHIDINDFT